MTKNHRAFSRRKFLQRGIQWSSVAGMSALARSSAATDRRATVKRKYIDVHVHLGQPWNERGELTAEQMLRWMDAHEIEQAWVLPLISPEAWFYPITTDWVLRQTKPFRDRLIPFCAVDRRTAVYDGKKHFVDVLRRYQDAGARGFGEHKWGGPIDDPRNIELMQTCAELQLPVLFHLDNHRNTDKPGLPGLEKVLEAVPKVKMIGHGPGWWASISGAVTQSDLQGYPKGKIAPGGALDRMMKKYPNLFADLSAGSGNNAIRRDTEFGRAFLIRHSKQVLFGTDYLAADQSIPQFETLEALNLPNNVAERVFRSNAETLILTSK